MPIIEDYEFKKLLNDIEIMNFEKLIEDETFCYISYDNYRNIPKQGWKIHISSTPPNTYKTLYSVFTYCDQRKINFKFVKTLRIYKKMNSKSTSRHSSSKFITIYPESETHFKNILQEISKIIGFMDAPYILSDKRYKNFNNIYYRYGRLKVDEGEGNNPYIKLPSGEMVIEQREPYYVEYPGIVDPVSDDFLSEEHEVDDNLIKNRYHVKEVIHSSTKGGIYLAEDTQSNAKVVIKECRPHITLLSETDSFEIFENEKNNFIEYSNTPFIPTYVDDFIEWEHRFLVVEYIEGTTLTNYLAKNIRNIYKDNSSVYNSNVENILLQIVDIINYFHKQDKVISDISSSNFIFKDNKVYLIDLETLAYVHEKKYFYCLSPGFAREDLISESKISMKNKDWMAFGFLIMKMYCNSNYYVDLDISLSKKNFKKACLDFNVPEHIQELCLFLIENKSLKINGEDIKNALMERNNFIINLKNEMNNFDVSIKQQSYDLDKEINMEIGKNIKDNKDLKSHFFKSLINKDYTLEKGAMAYLYIMLKEEKVEVTILLRYFTDLIDAIESVSPVGNWDIPISPETPHLRSPYLLNGIGGLIYLFQLLRKSSKYKEIYSRFEQLYYDILETLNVSFMSKYSISFGLSGIAILILNEYRFSKNNYYLDSTISMVKTLFYSNIVLDGELIYPTESFKKMDFSFTNGLSGIYYIYSELLKELGDKYEK